MRIFELLNQSPAQQVDPNTPNPEDDQDGKFDADKVDNSLQDVAQSVQDRDAQPDLPPGGEQPDPALDDQNAKPIDSALLGQIRNLPYSTRYQFDDNSPLNPLRLAGMEVQDLKGVLNMVRFKMQMTMMRDQVGADEDTDMSFYNDLTQFINMIMNFKKSNTKAQLAQTNPSPPYQTRARAANDNQPLKKKSAI